MERVRAKLLCMNEQRSQALEAPGYLFIGRGGHRAYFHNFMATLMARVRRLNPSVVNVKHIRSSVIVEWLKRYNLRKVQYLAGHRYISSTEWYVDNVLEGLQESIKRFHPLDNETLR